MTLQSQQILVPPEVPKELWAYYATTRKATLDALKDLVEYAPGLRRPRPTIVPFPVTYDRYPFPGNGVNKIYLDQGRLETSLGQIVTFQSPKGFVARSFFIIADGDVELVVYGKDRTWGPFFIEQMTPVPFGNLECVRLDLKCSPSFDAQILFSDDVFPPLEVPGFGAYPSIRYGEITTGAPGEWASVLFGAGNMSKKQLVPVAGRFPIIESMAVGRKHLMIVNTTANPANVRVRGSILLDDSMRNDAINGPGGSMAVPANDFLDVQFVTPWKSIQLQAQTPAGGSPTTLNVAFMGVSQGS